MKTHTAHKFGILIFLLLIVFGSCTQFFSTSLAPWARRDPDMLIGKVTADNVDDLIDMTAGDPDLSLALLKKIGGALSGANADDKAALQAAALQSAANATGMGSAILNQAANIINALEEPDNAAGLVNDALNDMKNLVETSDVLVKILPEPDTDEFTAFVNNADADDLAMAAVILLAAEAKNSGDSAGHLESFDSTAPDDLSDKEKLAVELALAAAGKGLDGPLKDLLDGLKLASSGP